MSGRLLFALRVLAALAVAVATWTTLWLARGGDPGVLAWLAGACAGGAVFYFATRPPPEPWGAPEELDAAGRPRRSPARARGARRP